MENKDFQFVQKEKVIQDIKLQTKPTTFFKDALKRFVKNKASVIAFSFISFLVSLSVLVPLFNTNNIDQPNTAARFLPPRWAFFEDLGIMDGTIVYRNIILDMTDPEKPVPAGFNPNAIQNGVDGITISQGFINNPSPFAEGGTVAIRPAFSTDGGIQSPAIFLPKNDDYIIELEIPETINSANSILPRYRLVADVKYFFNQDTRFPVILLDEASEFGLISISNIVPRIISNAPQGFNLNSIGSFNVRFKIEVLHENNQFFQGLNVQSFNLKSVNNPESNQFEDVNFKDGNSLLLRDLSEDRSFVWSVYAGAQKNVFQARVNYGTFKYNPYTNVFGNKTLIIGESEINSWIQQGLIEFKTPSLFPSLSSAERIDSLVRLSDASPLISINREIRTVGPDFTVYEYEAIVSMYRYYGMSAIPYYFFGTNHNGADYFKVVFSGLRTSLLLGLAGMLINVTFGMIWGSISGYFGGNIDLAMERFTEILGGVPWIVIMTLAILHLGNNFSTFLLAITLTGWIGTSSLTRSQFYRYKRREYVLASRTLGASDWRLIFRHILPNSIGPIVTSSVLLIPGIIFSEATISYLGLGLQGLPSLGVALSQAQEYLATSPYLIGWGSVIISILMISFNLFGNGLRDAFNPSLKGVE